MLSPRALAERLTSFTAWFTERPVSATRTAGQSSGARSFLVVVCHPVPNSFIRSAFDAVVWPLGEAGHQITVLDLDELGFDPLLQVSELDRIQPGAALPQDLQLHGNALRACTDLVLVYPTWFGSVPAKLKGWFDRVWRDGVAWDGRAGGLPFGHLGNITNVWVVTTHGSSKLVNSTQGEAGRRLLRRYIRLTCALRCRTHWVAFYGNDAADDAARSAFLQRVRTTFSTV